MIILNERTIEELITFEEVMAGVEKAFLAYEKGEFTMPDRIHVAKGENTLLYMPCFIDEIFGTKSLTIFPENSRSGKPVIDGTMTLNDPKTGELLATMDGKILTALRTGGVGGVGTKYLSPKDSSVLGVVGTGVQGYYQIMFIAKVRPIKKVRVYDLNRKRLEEFTQLVGRDLPGVEIVACRSTEELLDESHIIVTATSSTNPVLTDDPALLEGKTFIGIGSYKPTMREFPHSLFPLLDEIYTDTYFAKEESGDIVYPLENHLIGEDKIVTIGRAISGNEKGRKKTVLFKSVGMALLDLYVAKEIYEKAVKLDRGQKVTL